MPLLLSAVGLLLTAWFTGQQAQIARESAAANAKSALAVQYTELFLDEYKNVKEPSSKRVLRAITFNMRQLRLEEAEEFDRILDMDDQIVFTLSKLLEGYADWTTQMSNCPSDKSEENCIGFIDGRKWRVRDSILMRQPIAVSFEDELLSRSRR